MMWLLKQGARKVMLMLVGGAASTILLLLLKIWIEQEIKEHGWPGLTRKLGNIGFVLMAVHALLLALIVVICVIYHFRFGMPKSFVSFGRFDMREIVWFQGVFVPGMFAVVLLYFRKNIMMLVAGMALWAFGGFQAYAFWQYSPQEFDTNYFILNLESSVAWAISFMIIPFVVALASSAISWFYGVVDTVDK